MSPVHVGQLHWQVPLDSVHPVHGMLRGLVDQMYWQMPLDAVQGVLEELVGLRATALGLWMPPASAGGASSEGSRRSPCGSCGNGK